MTACGRERPASTSSSRTLSNIAESLPSASTTGRIFARSSPNSFDSNRLSRACIQLTLPRRVLISPLWQTKRYGCARAQFGKVLVEKRECTMARHDSTRGSTMSGK